MYEDSRHQQYYDGYEYLKKPQSPYEPYDPGRLKKRPLDRKPTRVAGIIETAHGILLVKDIKDTHKIRAIDRIKKEKNRSHKQMEAALRILEGGRFSLPGGKMRPGETPQQTLYREIKEELFLDIDYKGIIPVAQIIGETRDHLIYAIHVADGLIVPNGGLKAGEEKEISGIGFLKERGKNIMVPNNDFFQAHVVYIYNHYLDSVQREAAKSGFISQLSVNIKELEKWFYHESCAYMYRSSYQLKRQRMKAPLLPMEWPWFPNFEVLNDQNEPIGSDPDLIITRSLAAEIIPPSNPGALIRNSNPDFSKKLSKIGSK